jgi:hypothetical protein
MIIYGSKATFVTGELLYDTACPHCGTKGQTQGAVYARYAHIYWIPLFPIGKTAASECKHCLRTFVEGKDARELQPAYNEMKSHAKTPIWHWAGLALIGVLIVSSMFSTNKEAAQTKQFVAQPQIGDVYHVKLKSGNYTSMKVQSVEGDTISFFLNPKSVNKLSGMHKLESTVPYSDSLIGLYSKAELQTMLNSSEIVDIKR